MRVVIIGVGGVGAMAAWRLAKAGHSVVALEQFHVDHDRGSSYGDSRIVRRVYPDTLYTSLMAASYTLWEELKAEHQSYAPEGERGWELFTPCGGLFVGTPEHEQIIAATQALEASGVEFQVLDQKEVRRRFAAFSMQPDEVALYEPSMGYARASQCVRAAVSLARKRGASIYEGDPVVSIEPGSSGVRVRTASGLLFDADRLLICAGPWAKSFLDGLGMDLPLTVTRQSYVHFEVVGDPDAFAPRNFPVWIDARTNLYGFPQLGDVPGVKIASHDAGVAVDPNNVDRIVSEGELDRLRAYAAGRFPSLGSRIVYKKVCLYTVTPDNDFVIDCVPGLPGAYYISACSGHGFKFTPLMGQIAVELLATGCTQYDLSRFRLSRFFGNAYGGCEV